MQVSPDVASNPSFVSRGINASGQGRRQTTRIPGPLLTQPLGLFGGSAAELLLSLECLLCVGLIPGAALPIAHLSRLEAGTDQGTLLVRDHCYKQEVFRGFYLLLVGPSLQERQKASVTPWPLLPSGGKPEPSESTSGPIVKWLHRPNKGEFLTCVLSQRGG